MSTEVDHLREARGELEFDWQPGMQPPDHVRTQAHALTSIAESLVRIAAALEAMKPQSVEATLEEFDAVGFADRIAEALKSGEEMA